jgi:TANFOR domain-containing protein
MRTLSNIGKIKYLNRGITFFFLVLLPSLIVSGQNLIQINVSVAPPYSTKISDYTSNPGKIMASIINLSPTGSPASIYLSGSISGESGIVVRSEDGYKPSQPLVIPAGGSIQLNMYNIGDIFDGGHLVFENVSEADVINGNGLPEDFYTICFRAYDFRTDEPISGEEPSGCCAPFHVADIEPPFITQPICGEDVNAINPQSIIFSWTHPAGAPLMTRYRFTMVEVQPSDHSPEDAMNSARRPFFQTPDIITGTTYLYGPAQPPLTEGKTYAFKITAIDPSGGARFRNNGNSEVCSFTWKKQNLLLGDEGFGRKETEPLEWGSVNIQPPPLMLPTIVKGRLQYSYFDPGENKKYNLGGVNIRLVVGHATVNGDSELSLNNLIMLSVPPLNDRDDPEFGKTLATAKTDANGNFNFMFYDNTEYLNLGGSGKEVGDDVYRVALIVVESPQNSFYFNPVAYIVPQVGVTNDFGNVVSKVRSCQLELSAKPLKSTLFDYLNQAVGQDKLSGINVYLCRKIDFSYQVYPLEDGKVGNKTIDEATKAKFKNLGLSVLAVGITNDKEGKTSFQRVVWHHEPNYQYYIMADCNAEGDQNFILGAPVPFDPPPTVQLSNKGMGDPAIMPFPNFLNYQTLKKEINLTPQFPKVLGRVASIEDTKPLAGVVVNLEENYNLSNPADLRLIQHYTKVEENAVIKECMQSNCGQFTRVFFMPTASDGNFAFNDLAILYRNSTKQVCGAYRNLILVKDGYKTITSDIGLLAYGKQAVLNNLMMQKGAVLKGRVTDGETGDRVIAWVRQPGGKSYKCDRVTGAYEIPVMLLPGEQQQIIVEKQGYITDTINFTITKETTHLDVKIFQVKRRLRVYVHEKGKPLSPIKEAFVEFLNVNVTQNNKTVPLGYVTFDDGIVDASFTNGGDDPDIVYNIRVKMHNNTSRNFESADFSITIPVSKNPKYLDCELKPAACLSGHVYVGKNDTSFVGIAKITYNGWNDILTDVSNPNGYYCIKNVPVRRAAQIVTASKSQSNFIGDEQSVLINKPSDQCVSQDFHLTVYKDMDITHLMGFPMEVTKLVEEETGGVWINGNLTSLQANDQFSTSFATTIPFRKIYIKPGLLKNQMNVPIAEPVTLPVKMIPNTVDILVMGTFAAEMTNPDGIMIDKQPGSSFGIIKSKVKIASTEFNANNVTLPEIWLASSATGNARMLMTVLAADKNIKKPVNIPATGFWVCDSKGEALRYSMPKFQNCAITDPLKSYLLKDKVILNTSLHTNCINVMPADLNIKLGNVEITKSNCIIKPTEPLKLNLGGWKLESSYYTIGTNGLNISKAQIKAQIDFSVQNVEITFSSVNSDKTIADMSSMKILGAIPVDVTATNKGLVCLLNNGKYYWKLYATNIDKSKAASIKALPGLEGQDLGIESIQMLSDGTQPTFAPMADVLKMFNLVDFNPLYGSSIIIYDKSTPPYFMVQGIYKPNLPYIEQFNGNIAWIKKPDNKLDFSVNNPGKINFTHHNMLFEWDVNTIAMSNDLFTARGTATEAGKLGPVDVVLVHKTASTEIDIPSNALIYITSDHKKYFNKLVGGMEVDRPAHTWGNFWFEGVMVGMNGISNNPQESRMKFVCQGEIKADGQSINVNKMDAFPGMELTYDMANSRLHGSLNIDKNLMGLHTSGTANCIFDPYGWYLNVNGQLDIPGIGGCGLFGLFGDYSAVPPEIVSNFGALKCIPPEFQGKVSGFLLQGRLTKQIIPSIEWGVTIPVINQFVGVQLNADLSLNARTWMTFDPAVNTYGIALLAEGNINGGISAGVYNISTFANAQLGISGTYYSNGNFNVTGCGSVKAGVSAEVLTPMGWEGVSIASPDIGLKMKISNTGTDFGLMVGSCGDNLCPEPSL